MNPSTKELLEAIETVDSWNRANAERGHVTVPRVADPALLDRLVNEG